MPQTSLVGPAEAGRNQGLGSEMDFGENVSSFLETVTSSTGTFREVIITPRGSRRVLSHQSE